MEFCFTLSLTHVTGPPEPDYVFIDDLPPPPKDMPLPPPPTLEASTDFSAELALPPRSLR